MKTFIYFSQGEWRTFQAEHLPTSPVSSDFYYHSTYLKALEKYESEIAALKAKSWPVGNENMAVYQNEDGWFCDCSPKGSNKIKIRWIDHHLFQWPGTVEVKEHTPLGCETWADMEFVAILKLPETSKPIA